MQRAAAALTGTDKLESNKRNMLFDSDTSLMDVEFDYGSKTSYPNLSEPDEDDEGKQEESRKRAGVELPPINNGLDQQGRAPGGP